MPKRPNTLWGSGAAHCADKKPTKSLGVDSLAVLQDQSGGSDALLSPTGFPSPSIPPSLPPTLAPSVPLALLHAADC